MYVPLLDIHATEPVPNLVSEEITRPVLQTLFWLRCLIVNYFKLLTLFCIHSIIYILYRLMM